MSPAKTHIIPCISLSAGRQPMLYVTSGYHRPVDNIIASNARRAAAPLTGSTRERSKSDINPQANHNEFSDFVRNSMHLPTCACGLNLCTFALHTNVE